MGPPVILYPYIIADKHMLLTVESRVNKYSYLPDDTCANQR